MVTFELTGPAGPLQEIAMSADDAGPAGSELSEGLGPVACATCGERPYYTKAHIAAAVAAERERWRALIEARAARCERAAENTDDPKFDAMARILMSVREDGSRA